MEQIAQTSVFHFFQIFVKCQSFCISIETRASIHMFLFNFGKYCYFHRRILNGSEAVLKTFVKFKEKHRYKSLTLPRVVDFWTAVEHLKTLWYHGIIIRTGITWKKIRCNMCNSACRWCIVRKAEIFWSYVKHFWIFAGMRDCAILIGLCK